MGVKLRRADNSTQKEFIPCFDHKHRDWNGIEFGSAKAIFSERLKTLGVNVISRCETLELVQQDDRVCGAVVAQAGGLAYIGCRALVLATGGYGGIFKYHLCTEDVSGLGQTLALNAGCALVNMEFMQMMPGYISPAYQTVFNEKTFRFTEMTCPDGAPLLREEQKKLLVQRSTYGPFTSRLASREIDYAIFNVFQKDARGVVVRYNDDMKRDPPEFVQTYFNWLRSARGVTMEKLHEITKIDYFFLHKYLNLYNMECRLKEGNIDAETYLRAKKMGYPDKAIERLSGEKVPMHRDPVYKMVDTCAAEFAAETPYFYATYDDENEAKEFLDERPKKPCVVVLGSGPIRIGQGIEFDYASVHCVWMLKQAGYDVVMINNNPETVSTDFDTADRLYFEPLTAEDVLGVIATEKPVGVVAAFGGQTAIKLTHALDQAGVRIMGTSADMIDAAEDRERFDAAMEKYGIKRAKGRTVMTSEEAVAAANELGYPVLVRPSYVLGGQNMIIAYQDSDIVEYMRIILAQGIENPVLIDQYLMGIEAEADAICDGTDVLIPGIMEHVERSGIHSGDSIAVYPAWNLTGAMTQRLIEVTRQIALELGTLGLINIQYIVYHNEVYVIEANPRASRTVPYISKVTGVPMVDLAVRAMLGEKIRDMGYGTGLYRQSPYYAVKVPCFSFEKLADVDTHLGPEMKSTGEVLGIGTNLQEAIFKGLVAAGYKMRHQGGILVSVRDKDKPEAIDCARKFAKLGFNIFATPGTARAMQEHGLYAAVVKKEAQEKMLEMGQVQYVISTSNKGRLPQLESVRMRRKAVERGIPLFTSLDTANALANALTSRYSLGNVELVDINNMRTKHKKLTFTKMRGTGNDYLYFDCFDQTVESPESLAVRLSNRRTGVGSDGIVLIMPSNIADAKMRMFNADGTEGSVAGNALRCVCKYLYENGHVRKDEMAVETGSGVKTAKLFIREDQVFSVLVDMGCPAFAPAKIPVKLDGDRVMMRPVFLAGEKREISCVSMGNPHVVIFVEDVNRIPLEQVGPQIETDSLFPERVNVSFAQIVDKNDIVMRVWERGIGETAACGTGACAVAVAAVENGFCTRGADIDVRLPGGTLVVRYQEDGKVWLTGDANTDFTGTIEI